MSQKKDNNSQEAKMFFLLKTLDKTERKDLNKFLHSPYFNNNQKIIVLWDYLEKYAPDYDTPQLASKKIFSKIFPQEKFEERKLRQLRWQLLKLVKEFLAIERFRKDELTKKKKLKEAYYEKDLYEWFETISKEIEKIINGQAIKSESDYYELLQINYDLYFNQRSNKVPTNLNQCGEQLEHFYWLSKLKYACEWVCREGFNKEAIPPYVNSLALPKKLLNPDYPLFYLYHHVYLIYNKSSEAAAQLFFKTMKLFEDNFEKISKNDQTFILLYLLNYSIAASRKKEDKYFPVTFRLLKLGLSAKILFWKGQLHESSFINIVFISSKLKEFKWAQQFILDSHQFLDSKNSKFLIGYANSVISFYQEKYEDAFSQLEVIKFSNITRELSRKSLQIRCGFECFLKKPDFYSLLLSKSENFKKFLKRKELVEASKKNAYFNLNEAIKETAKLINTRATKKAYTTQKSKINNQLDFVEKKWILDHLEGLIKEYEK